MLASEIIWPPDHELAPGSPIAGPQLPTPELSVRAVARTCNTGKGYTYKGSGIFPSQTIVELTSHIEGYEGYLQ